MMPEQQDKIDSVDGRYNYTNSSVLHLKYWLAEITGKAFALNVHSPQLLVRFAWWKKTTSYYELDLVISYWPARVEAFALDLHGLQLLVRLAWWRKTENDCALDLIKSFGDGKYSWERRARYSSWNNWAESSMNLKRWWDGGIRVSN